MVIGILFTQCSPGVEDFEATYFETHETNGDSTVFLKLKLYNGEISGESLRKDKGIILYLKGSPTKNGEISFREFLDGGECFGEYTGGRFTTKERGYLECEWSKPDKEKGVATYTFSKIDAEQYFDIKRGLGEKIRGGSENISPEQPGPFANFFSSFKKRAKEAVSSGSSSTPSSTPKREVKKVEEGKKEKKVPVLSRDDF